MTRPSGDPTEPVDKLVGFLKTLATHAGHNCQLAKLRDEDKPFLNELIEVLRALRDTVVHQRDDVTALSNFTRLMPTDARFQAATAAMQSIISRLKDSYVHASDLESTRSQTMRDVAAWSVGMADALLEELTIHKQPEATAGQSPAHVPARD